MSGTVRSRNQARAWFENRGLVVSSWARSNQFSPDLVYGVLAGRLRGRRGEAHRIAVALGLKPNVSQPDEPFAEPSSRSADSSEETGMT